MTTPQNGIFAQGHRYFHALEYRLKDTASGTSIADALTAAQNPSVDIVIAFGPQMWARLARGAMPDGFRDFQAIKGQSFEAPSTQRDVFVWIHGSAQDDIMDGVMALNAELSKHGRLELDVPGFMYHDARDLTGFVDGSANPKDEAGRREAALVPRGEAGAGGSIVFSQLWEHDLAKFNSLAVAEQERVFGRTKADSIELEGDAMPNNSHVSRTDLKIDGVAQKMFRRSFPFGTAEKQGLYFLAFCCDQDRIENVLNSMFGLSDDAISDHLLSFTTPKTGSYWFAPSEEDLAKALS